jgi:uncharacterized protein YdeI (YjbR/CyaY-like superfamily)
MPRNFRVVNPGIPVIIGPRMKDLADTGVAWTTMKDWESWLAKNHKQESGLWLLIAKKGSKKVSITIGEALNVALCYGWIDSQRKGYDADYYLQRYSPRRPKSPWSKINVEKVEALITARRMRKPGLAAIASAKADGRWDVAYVSQRNAAIPPDLAAALKRNKRAGKAFEQLDRTGRYLITLRLLKATTPAVRLARLKKAIAQLEALH